MQQATPIIIYALECRGGKYYVGSCPAHGVRSHVWDYRCGRGGTAWTARHPAIRLVRGSSRVCAEENKQEEEEMLVIELMRKHGINNVRGGPYQAIYLPRRCVADIWGRLAATGASTSGCGAGASSIMDEELPMMSRLRL